jgi:hypothetical protein
MSRTVRYTIYRGAAMRRNKRLGVIMASALLSGGALLGASAAPAGAVVAPPQTATVSTAAAQATPPGRGTPDISFRECSGETTTWVDIDIVLPSGVQDWCFGGKGTWQFFAPNNVVTYFCSGNNHGTFSYSGAKPLGFLPGFRKPFSYVHAGYLAINGWSGGATCTS